MEELLTEAQTYGSVFGVDFGHWAGAAAIMLFVIVRSVMWYAIPDIVQWKEDDLQFVRSNSTWYRVVNRTTILLSIAGIGVSAYLVGGQAAFIYTLVFVNLFTIITSQEGLRRHESVKAAGFDTWGEAIEAQVKLTKQRIQDIDDEVQRLNDRLGQDDHTDHEHEKPNDQRTPLL